MKVNLYQFEVKGAGRFPLDMLRHGQCWPDDQDAADNIQKVHRTPVIIRLNAVALPDSGRWKSFGWQVVASSVKKL